MRDGRELVQREKEADGMSTEQSNGAGRLVVKCDCGFEAKGSEAELIPIVQQHGREAHNMDVTREQVLAMAQPA
jgi:predicted small metal-binding protein